MSWWEIESGIESAERYGAEKTGLDSCRAPKVYLFSFVSKFTLLIVSSCDLSGRITGLPDLSSVLIFRYYQTNKHDIEDAHPINKPLS